MNPWSQWLENKQAGDSVLTDLRLNPVQSAEGLSGGYCVPVAFMHGLRKVDAYWRRRERKAWRRYQHQKRKQ